MARTTKAQGLSVPPAVVKEVETLARQERRTEGELFQEMVRVYRRYRAQRDRDDDQWIEDLIREAKAEQANSPMSVEALLKESDRLASYGAQRAKRLGIKPADVNRIVHEHRKAQRA
jgi:hypothetical protein